MRIPLLSGGFSQHNSPAGWADNEYAYKEMGVRGPSQESSASSRATDPVPETTRVPEDGPRGESPRPTRLQDGSKGLACIGPIEGQAMFPPKPNGIHRSLILARVPPCAEAIIETDAGLVCSCPSGRLLDGDRTMTSIASDRDPDYLGGAG